MTANRQGQRILGVSELGLTALSNRVHHVKGSTAETLSKPADEVNVQALYLDVEAGFFRLCLGDYETAGSEEVTNGAFGSDSDWTKGTGWSISGGTASSDASQTEDSDLTQDLDGLTVGDFYTVSFTVSGRSAGTVEALLGDQSSGEKNADATYTVNLVAGEADPTLTIRADADFDGNIDDVSVKKMILTNSDPVDQDDYGAGSIKISSTKSPIMISSPDKLTVVGEDSDSILTYYWL